MRSLPVWAQIIFPTGILALGIWFGYYSCDHDLVFELTFLGPLFLIAFLLFAGLSLILIALVAPKGWRISFTLIHIILLLTLIAFLPFAADLGTWLWEQRVLRPRAAAMRRPVVPSPDFYRQAVAIDGYEFAAAQSTPEGTLFYLQLLGGPFASRGVFVAGSQDVQMPSVVRTLTPTSVPGLYWFLTND